MSHLASRTARRLAAALIICLPACALGQGAPVTRAGAAEAPAASGGAVQPQALFELANQIERLRAEVADLRGQVERQRHEIEALRTQQRDLYVDVDRRLQAVETGGAAGRTGTPPLPTLPAAEAPAVGPAGPGGPGLAIEVQPPAAGGAGALAAAPAATIDPGAAAPHEVPGADPEGAEQAYRAAFDLLKGGQYDDAIAAFNAYLVEYPVSSLADNAQYWLGEAYYVTRQFEAAVAEYQKLLQAYPQSPKASHALLKIGYSYQELGRIDLAREHLAQVVKNYPGTTAARLAEERLQRLPGVAPQS